MQTFGYPRLSSRVTTSSSFCPSGHSAEMSPQAFMVVRPFLALWVALPPLWEARQNHESSLFWDHQSDSSRHVSRSNCPPLSDLFTDQFLNSEDTLDLVFKAVPGLDHLNQHRATDLISL